MLTYLTYLEYQKMGGTLSEGDFDWAYRHARAELDYQTLGRLRNEKAVSDNVKQCMVEMIDVCAAGDIQYGSPDGVQAVTSTSNDGVSVSYATPSMADWYDKIYPRRVRGIIETYLADERNAAGMQLLYRGCG